MLRRQPHLESVSQRIGLTRPTRRNLHPKKLARNMINSQSKYDQSQNDHYKEKHGLGLESRIGLGDRDGLRGGRGHGAHGDARGRGEPPGAAGEHTYAAAIGLGIDDVLR